MKHQTVTIIGGGIAGLTTAIALHRIGIDVQIFEASKQIEPLGAGLGLGINAMIAFKELGIYQEVIQHGRILPSFSIYDHFGKPITKTNFEQTTNIGNFTIHRGKLQQILLSQLAPSAIQLDKRVEHFETTDNGVELTFKNGSTHLTNYLIVADGIHSVIRQKLVPSASSRYAGYTCWRAIINNHTLNIDETSETWGPDGRFGLIPLADKTLYWFACVNTSFNNPKFKSYTVADLQHHFRRYHDPIPEILKHTLDNSLIHNDILDIRPINQFAFGRIVLIGDAAHATTPNMGQGACQAIEDAATIAQCMSRETDFEQAFRTFEKRRLKRTKWITDTSWKIGQLAQLENPLLIWLRNVVLRSMPTSVSAKQMKKIEAVDFLDAK
ncbi:MAG: hypothetical protein DHS20C18_37840 [Saprospiraceae bacterium]|nr:MAG: hypothetical protein DHS20C18_37840 [Saprospiraceae bacterium]